MTQLLETVLQVIYKLPPNEQDMIATLIMDELADEERWETALMTSQDKLSQLAKKVRADIHSGKTKKMGFDEL